jgi:class 3 adenylate cyclase
LGWVHGDDQVAMVANLIQTWAEQTLGRKRLGAEVLNLYREINLIYDFSEKLVDIIDPSDIARTALEEAQRLIPFNSGAVVLWDEQQLRFDILAHIGIPLLTRKDLFATRHAIRNIAATGRTEIVNDVDEFIDYDWLPVKAVMHAALKVKNRSIGTIVLASFEPITYTAADLKLITTLALQAAAAIESSQLHEKTVREALDREEAMRRIHEVTSKFVPFEFIRALGRNSLTEVRLGDHTERKVTVMFTDIREFTTLAEQMTPEACFDFVGELNGIIGPIIRQHRGFINQYLGDGIMAIFPEEASDALRAAINIQKALETYNHAKDKRLDHGLDIGIGMHTGLLIMGITGDHERLEATTISDTVNTAARIEGLTKLYRTPILFSKETLDHIRNASDFSISYLGEVQVKGKQAPVSIYACNHHG